MCNFWFIGWNNEFVFPDSEPSIINILYGWLGISGQFGLFLYVFFYKIINSNYFCTVLFYCYIYYYIATSLLFYVYVSIKSIDYILLSSFELKAILLVSSMKTMSLSLLSLCCIFNIDLLFLYKCFDTFYVNLIFFYSQVDLFLNSFYNFQI